MTKAVDGYKKHKHPHGTYPTKFFPNGGYVIKDNVGNGAEGYDSKGRYLGLGLVHEVEKMVETGRVNILNHTEACDLAAWELWKDAIVNGGVVPLQYDDKTQLIAVGDDIYLQLTEEDDTWLVEWLAGCDVEERYYNVEDQCYDLRYADKPFKPE